ncbi:MAG: pyridoxamine 5'-phosphate oxidase family protein [Candidatus Paceibacterota bacterium]
METEEPRARTDALAFLKRNRTGILATVAKEWTPIASAVHYTADDNFNIYFLTLMSSRKYAALSAHPEVAFTVMREDVPQTLQIEGTAMDISLSAEASAKKDELFEILNKNLFFYPPISKLDPAESAIIWLKPNWIRWADYAFAKPGSDQAFKKIVIQTN